MVRKLGTRRQRKWRFLRSPYLSGTRNISPSQTLRCNRHWSATHNRARQENLEGEPLLGRTVQPFHCERQVPIPILHASLRNCSHSSMMRIWRDFTFTNYILSVLEPYIHQHTYIHTYVCMHIYYASISISIAMPCVKENFP